MTSPHVNNAGPARRRARVAYVTYATGLALVAAAAAVIATTALAPPALAEEGTWFAFAPKPDPFRSSSAIDLRGLNEKVAGEGGFIGTKGGQFIHAKTGARVRFWAVTGPSGKDRPALKREARVLAKRGVNLVRIHHAWYDAKGQIDRAAVLQGIEAVDALKAEGIYTHFSIYFPIWLAPEANTPWLKGYDGKAKPFATLMFDPDFQAHYRDWWKALLLTPNPAGGKRLIDEPAVAGLEIQNEDSFLFWTFNEKQIPDAQLRGIEGTFAAWLAKKYGSPAAAIKAWGNQTLPRDRPGEARIAFRPLWNIAHEKTRRDQDTARFLAETQREFYRSTYAFLRELGFKGVITASNWTTADAEVLGPIEKYTYTPGDFIDRHGYFSCLAAGNNAEWSVQNGHTYADRSALRFESEEPGKPKVFSHPVMDPSYASKPSMISETTFNRPNRFRTEAPLYYAAYAALQGTDAVVHFTDDTSEWSVKPGYFMQPWTTMTPAMMGQFPAAALIYRKGLVAEGDVLVDLNLRPDDLFALKGTPLPQDASLDELRLKDVPKAGQAPKAGQVIDPLVYYAGRTQLTFEDQPRAPVIKDLRPYIDRVKQTVVSTNGQLKLDYGKGLMALNAPSAQGVCGALKAAGEVDLPGLKVRSTMELGAIVAVSLDDQPIERSGKILLQIMSEEKATGFRVSGSGARKTIVDIGHDPWLVREFEGTVAFKRPDASKLKVTALDANGDPLKSATGAAPLRLGKTVLYYLIEAPKP